MAFLLGVEIYLKRERILEILHTREVGECILKMILFSFSGYLLDNNANNHLIGKWVY